MMKILVLAITCIFAVAEGYKLEDLLFMGLAGTQCSVDLENTHAHLINPSAVDLKLMPISNDVLQTHLQTFVDTDLVPFLLFTDYLSGYKDPNEEGNQQDFADTVNVGAEQNYNPHYSAYQLLAPTGLATTVVSIDGKEIDAELCCCGTFKDLFCKPAFYSFLAGLYAHAGATAVDVSTTQIFGAHEYDSGDVSDAFGVDPNGASLWNHVLSELGNVFGSQIHPDYINIKRKKRQLEDFEWSDGSFGIGPDNCAAFVDGVFRDYFFNDVGVSDDFVDVFGFFPPPPGKRGVFGNEQNFQFGLTAHWNSLSLCYCPTVFDKKVDMMFAAGNVWHTELPWLGVVEEPNQVYNASEQTITTPFPPTVELV